MSCYAVEQNADGTWVITFATDDSNVVQYRNVATTVPGTLKTAAVNVTNWSTYHNINDRWKSVTESTGACTTR